MTQNKIIETEGKQKLRATEKYCLLGINYEIV